MKTASKTETEAATIESFVENAFSPLSGHEKEGHANAISTCIRGRLFQV